jgi:hypothetical protein
VQGRRDVSHPVTSNASVREENPQEIDWAE